MSSEQIFEILSNIINSDYNDKDEIIKLLIDYGRYVTDENKIITINDNFINKLVNDDIDVDIDNINVSLPPSNWLSFN